MSPARWEFITALVGASCVGDPKAPINKKNLLGVWGFGASPVDGTPILSTPRVLSRMLGMSWLSSLPADPN